MACPSLGPRRRRHDLKIQLGIQAKGVPQLLLTTFRVWRYCGPSHRYEFRVGGNESLKKTLITMFLANLVSRDPSSHHMTGNRLSDKPNPHILA